VDRSSAAIDTAAQDFKLTLQNQNPVNNFIFHEVTSIATRYPFFCSIRDSMYVKSVESSAKTGLLLRKSSYTCCAIPRVKSPVSIGVSSSITSLSTANCAASRFFRFADPKQMLANTRHLLPL
jgi:hypothetical protein